MRQGEGENFARAGVRERSAGLAQSCAGSGHVVYKYDISVTNSICFFNLKTAS